MFSMIRERFQAFKDRMARNTVACVARADYVMRTIGMGDTFFGGNPGGKAEDWIIEGCLFEQTETLRLGDGCHRNTITGNVFHRFSDHPIREFFFGKTEVRRFLAGGRLRVQQSGQVYDIESPVIYMPPASDISQWLFFGSTHNRRWSARGIDLDRAQIQGFGSYTAIAST